MTSGRGQRPSGKRLAGIFDAESREPRIILYIFIALATIVFIPFFSEVRPLVQVALLTGGPAIAVLSLRSWRNRGALGDMARMTVESGVIFGILLTILGIVDVLGIRPFGG